MHVLYYYFYRNNFGENFNEDTRLIEIPHDYISSDIYTFVRACVRACARARARARVCVCVCVCID